MPNGWLINGYTKTITLCKIPYARRQAEAAIAELLGTTAFFYDFPAYGAMVCYHCNEDCDDQEGPKFWCYGAWYRGKVFELSAMDSCAYSTTQTRKTMMDELQW